MSRDKSCAQDRFETVRYRIDGSTAWIVLDRPEHGNAMSSRMYGEVRDAVRLAELADDVDAVVITGTGPDFSRGGDLYEGQELLNSDDPFALFAFEDKLPFYTIANCSKTTIAAVNGCCVGGGLIIALCTDLLIAVRSARFGVPEGKAGLVEPWTPRLLYGRISLTDIKYLILTGELVSADEAREMRMINQVVDDDALTPGVEEALAKVRKVRPEARAAYKDALRSFDELASPTAASTSLIRARDRWTSLSP